MLKLKEDVSRDGGQGEDVPPGGKAPLASILTQRFVDAGRPAQKANPIRPGSLGRLALQIGVPLLVIAGVLWADSRGHFLLRGSRDPGPSVSLPDRWTSDDRREGAAIRCAMEPDSPAGGGSGYWLTVQVTAGQVLTAGKLYPDRTGVCHVEILDPNGAMVLSQNIPLASLAPSAGGGGYRGQVATRGRYTAVVTYSYKGHTIGRRVKARL